jgi:hypothetical protein
VVACCFGFFFYIYRFHQWLSSSSMAAPLTSVASAAFAILLAQRVMRVYDTCSAFVNFGYIHTP